MRIYKLVITDDGGKTVSETFHTTAKKAETYIKDLEKDTNINIPLKNIEMVTVEVY